MVVILAFLHLLFFILSSLRGKFKYRSCSIFVTKDHKGVAMFTRGFLVGVRRKAFRRRVWYSALDRVERGILSLTSQIVDRVESRVLGVELVKILAKLRDAMKSAFTRHVESYGFKRVVQLVKQAKAMGCERALEWLHDMSFIRYLTFIDINQPIGYH